MRVTNFTRCTNLALVSWTPDLGLKSAQINVVFFFVVSFRSRVNFKHRFTVCRFEIVLSYRIDFENGELATALHRVVAHASPRCDREVFDSWTLPFQRLVIPTIFADHSDEVCYDVPCKDSLLELASEVDLNGFWHS